LEKAQPERETASDMNVVGRYFSTMPPKTRSITMKYVSCAAAPGTAGCRQQALGWKGEGCKRKIKGRADRGCHVIPASLMGYSQTRDGVCHPAVPSQSM